MIKRKRGFSLIEIIISMAIASFIMIMLYQTLAQMTATTHYIRNTIDRYKNTLPIISFIEKDIMGIFVPKEFQQQNSMTNNRSEKGPFICLLHDQLFIKMIFYTTHIPGNLFSYDPTEVHPIVYKLVETVSSVDKPDDKKKYALVRESGMSFSDASLSENKKIYEYVLITGITKCSITFTAFIKNEGQEKKVILKEWGTDKQKKEAALILPHTVTFSFTKLNDDKTEGIFFLTFSIPSASCSLQQGLTVKPKNNAAVPPQLEIKEKRSNGT